jgi:hypothetical protein
VVEALLPAEPIGQEGNEIVGDGVQKNSQKPAHRYNADPEGCGWLSAGRKAACPQHSKAQRQRGKMLSDLHASPYIGPED